MTDTSKTFSRRSMLAGIAAVPSLAAPLAAQLPETKAAAEQTRVSIGAQSGPRIGIQEGPHLSTL